MKAEETWAEQATYMYDFHIQELQETGSMWEKLLKKYLGNIPGKKVLDTGCGTGFLSVILAKNGWKVTAIDNSSDMLEQAKVTAEQYGLSEYITFLKRDAEHTSTPQADVELPLTEIHEGDLYFCLEERKVSVRGKKVDLSAREFNTLYLLLMNRKRVMTFEIIAYHVWGEEYVENGLTAIHNIMSRLRKRLKISSDIPDYIISVRGVGYKFDTIQQKK